MTTTAPACVIDGLELGLRPDPAVSVSERADASVVLPTAPPA